MFNPHYRLYVLAPMLHLKTRNHIDKMGYGTLFSVFLILCVKLDTTEGNQIKKLKKSMNILSDKFSSLEDKMYNEGFDMRREIEAIWRQINATGEIENSDDVKAGKDVPYMAYEVPRVADVDKMIRKINESNELVIKGFLDEKHDLRDRITKFENDMLTFRNRHEHELSTLRSSLRNLAVELNDTMTDRLDKLDNIFEQTAVNVQQELNNEFDSLNMSFSQDFDNLKDSIVEWNNNGVTLLENRVKDMEVEQKYTLTSFMNKANETLTRLTSTSEDVVKKATAAQDFAQAKAKEFETMTQTIQKVSNEYVTKSEYMIKLNSLYVMNCLSVGGKLVGLSCFTLSAYTASWTKAAEDCSKMGGRLATLYSWGNKEVAKFDADNFWIGGSDIENEGDWIWQDGNLIEYWFYERLWYWGEPNGNRRENCLAVYGAANSKAGRWISDVCENMKKFVCEFKINVNN